MSSLDWNPTWSWFRAGIVGSSAFLCFLLKAGRSEEDSLCLFSTWIEHAGEIRSQLEVLSVVIVAG